MVRKEDQQPKKIQFDHEFMGVGLENWLPFREPSFTVYLLGKPFDPHLIELCRRRALSTKNIKQLYGTNKSESMFYL